jgi:opacity protein-like surface antigen
MKKSFQAAAMLAFILAMPPQAMAQIAPTTKGCPPGSGFCAESPAQKAIPAGQPVQPLQPLPNPETSAAPTERPETPESSAHAPPPPPVVYEPPPATIVRPEAPPRYEYILPPRMYVSRRHEWGLNLHLQGAIIGSGGQGAAGLGGGGVGLRLKPVRNFGIEGDLDFSGGDHEFQGRTRNETAFSLNALVFLNPRSRAQVYLLGGIGWAGAHVTCDRCIVAVDDHYSYFGGQAGVGLEFRFTRVLAFNLDLRGFIRGRTDELARVQPEFDSPTGCSANAGTSPVCRTTNTASGGLLTGGMTLYF